MRSTCVPWGPVMYFPALLAARFLGQPALSLTAILTFGSRLSSSTQNTSSKRFEMFMRKTKMAAGSRSLWSSLQRPVVVSRSNFALCYRTNQLRVKSSEALEYTARKGLFQRRGFWLFFGSSTVLGFTAYHNRLWEARQRRRLRVSVEGVGRFFRQVKY